MAENNSDHASWVERIGEVLFSPMTNENIPEGVRLTYAVVAGPFVGFLTAAGGHLMDMVTGKEFEEMGHMMNEHNAGHVEPNAGHLNESIHKANSSHQSPENSNTPGADVYWEVDLSYDEVDGY